MLRVQRIRGCSAARTQAESELRAAGFDLPPLQRSEWARSLGADDLLLLLARDDQARIRGLLNVRFSRSRALPGHRLYHVTRWASDLARGAEEALAHELSRVIRRDMLCLRAVVEVFERDGEARRSLAVALQRAGFQKSSVARGYTHTLVLDLRRSSDEIFSALHKTARRHVRAPAKRGLDLRAIVDEHYAPRIAFLMRETFRRTGGKFGELPWRDLLRMSRALPEDSRIVGLFAPGPRAPDDLVAVAWGCVHGRYATYESGGSERRSELGNLAMSYAPLWDLIEWAAANPRLDWFDLGGVSLGGAHDTRAGIDEAKQYFSENVVEAGEEWFMEPHAIRAAFARSLGRVVERLAR